MNGSKFVGKSLVVALMFSSGITLGAGAALPGLAWVAGGTAGLAVTAAYHKYVNATRGVLHLSSRTARNFLSSALSASLVAAQNSQSALATGLSSFFWIPCFTARLGDMTAHFPGNRGNSIMSAVGRPALMFLAEMAKQHINFTINTSPAIYGDDDRGVLMPAACAFVSMYTINRVIDRLFCSIPGVHTPDSTPIDEATANRLIDEGYVPVRDVEDMKGRTMLGYVCSYTNQPTIAKFLKDGHDINAPDAKKRVPLASVLTPLDEVRTNRDVLREIPSMIKELVKAGACLTVACVPQDCIAWQRMVAAPVGAGGVGAAGAPPVPDTSNFEAATLPPLTTELPIGDILFAVRLRVRPSLLIQALSEGLNDLEDSIERENAPRKAAMLATINSSNVRNEAEKNMPRDIVLIISSYEKSLRTDQQHYKKRADEYLAAQAQHESISIAVPHQD